MIISRLQFAAMARVKIPETERKDFYVYADEFQNFATESFSSVLSEARKYRLNLIIAHQYIDQLPEEVRDAVFGNVGTIVSFTVGSRDGKFLEREFSPIFLESDLVNLQRHYIYIKMMIDGMTSNPFSAITLPSENEVTQLKGAIVDLSREKYSRPLDLVESRINKWTSTNFRSGMKIVVKKPDNSVSTSSPVNKTEVEVTNIETKEDSQVDTSLPNDGEPNLASGEKKEDNVPIDENKSPNPIPLTIYDGKERK